MVLYDEYELLGFLGTPDPTSGEDSADEWVDETTEPLLDNEFETLVYIWHMIREMSGASGLFDKLQLYQLYNLAHNTSTCFQKK